MAQKYFKDSDVPFNRDLFINGKHVLFICTWNDPDDMIGLDKSYPYWLIFQDKLTAKFYCNMVIDHIDGRAAQVEMLYVDRRVQGKGWGKACLSYVIETFNVRFIDVASDNETAKKLYHGLGFEVYGREDYYDPDYTILKMRLK